MLVEFLKLTMKERKIDNSTQDRLEMNIPPSTCVFYISFIGLRNFDLLTLSRILFLFLYNYLRLQLI